MPTVAEVLPWYHDDMAAFTRHVMASLAQTQPLSQLIVVNDGTPVDLAPVLRQFRRPELEIILCNILVDIPWNVSGAKNCGIYQCTTDYVSIMDVDTIPSPGYVATAVQHLEGDKQCQRWLCPGIQEWDKQPYIYAPGSFVCRRAELQAVGMFNERFAGSWGYEDIELQWRLPRFRVHGLPLTTLSQSRPAHRDATRNRAIMHHLMHTKTYPTNWLKFPWEKITI